LPPEGGASSAAARLPCARIASNSSRQATLLAGVAQVVNASRPPGEWQAYDIVFEAPRFEGDKLVRPAYATVFFNGVLVHHRKEILGTMVHRAVAKYTPHDAEEPLSLQDHGHKVRYRNVWIRRLAAYDQPER
jgi:hypothetical protein